MEALQRPANNPRPGYTLTPEQMAQQAKARKINGQLQPLTKAQKKNLARKEAAARKKKTSEKDDKEEEGLDKQMNKLNINNDNVNNSNNNNDNAQAEFSLETETDLNVLNKKLRAANKKVRQIEDLKAKLASQGEIAEINDEQKEKLGKEAEFKKLVSDIENRIDQLK